MTVIFYLSSQSTLPGPVRPFAVHDKILHAVMFGGLSLLFLRAWKKEGFAHAAVLAIMATTLYGISDEFHQSFVPGRVADIWDVATDAVGSLVALVYRK